MDNSISRASAMHGKRLIAWAKQMGARTMVANYAVSRHTCVYACSYSACMQ